MLGVTDGVGEVDNDGTAEFDGVIEDAEEIDIDGDFEDGGDGTGENEALAE